jgi:hypothetical protein
MFCCLAMSSSAFAATGSIGSNQPCSLTNGASSCTVTVNYSFSGTPIGCVWLVDSSPAVVSCEGNSPASFSWAFATLAGSRFELRAHNSFPTNNASGYSSGTLLASHVAFARNPTAVSRPSDLSGDGKSDLIFRNSSTGEINAWLMNGGTVTANLGLVGPGNWTVSHTADFNGDGKADILFRNDDGSVSLWLMNGLSPISQVGLLGADPNWRVSHVGDFNGDGKADILWRNTNGAVTLWLMNGTTVVSQVGLLGPDPGWSVTHVADFNGDGKADLLWQNTNGAVTIWLMNGSTTTSAVGILGPNPDWRVSHTADLNGDGKADLLWRNINGAVTAWLMNGTTNISAAGILSDPNWSISHTADFNGDGKADLLWRNTNGAVTIWLMNGLTNSGAVGLLGADPNWRVTHIGDYNGDGRADVVWRNTADGSIRMWLIDGGTILSQTSILGTSPWVVMPPPAGATVSPPPASCALVINVNSQLAPAENIPWAGCNSTGVGVQSALDHVASLGGGEIKLTGSGSVLVGPALKVGNRTTIYGDPSRAPYGMTMIGANCGSSSYRACPIFLVQNQTSSSNNGGANIVIQNLDFDGTNSSFPLVAPAVDIQNSNKVRVLSSRIRGARRFGITVLKSTDIFIQSLSLDLVRSSSGEPEGGAGIWITQSVRTTLENSTITEQYYLAGLPQGDSRASASAPPTMDVVASYGSTNTVIHHNTIKYGNTAGIYIAACTDPGTCSPVGTSTARDVGATLWDNDIQYQREYGIDIANADQVSVLTNRVSFVGDSPISLADVRNSSVQWNTLSEGSSNPTTIDGLPKSTLYLQWGSTGNYVANNSIYGGGAAYTVFFQGTHPLYGSVTSNQVINNSLWTGAIGHFGGAVNGNTIAPNSTY